MQVFTTVSSRAVPFSKANVDTDIIIPAAYLKTIKRSGLGQHAFQTVRYNQDGDKVQDNVFDLPAYQGAQILLAGPNFGCGSSREHAPWALLDMGFRCIIAPSFADIFNGNCAKNGILTIELPQDQMQALYQDGESLLPLSVDLMAQTVSRISGEVLSFDYDASKKHMLLNGLDEIGLTLQKTEQIKAYEVRQQQQTPWLF